MKAKVQIINWYVRPRTCEDFTTQRQDTTQ